MSSLTKWLRWVGVLGVALFVSGMLWVGVFNYRTRNYAEAVKYELRVPWTPRLMVFFGSALLVISGATIGLTYLRARK